VPSVRIVEAVTHCHPKPTEVYVIRRVLAVVAVVVCTVGLAGCGDDDSGGGQDLQPKVIDVTISGDSVTPNGDRVDVKVDQPIQLVVKADVAGEIHVHSDPEHELEYDAGTTTLKTFTIDKPGIIEVESHALEKTIVQLEVK
jgi:predicted small secreted protein